MTNMKSQRIAIIAAACLARLTHAHTIGDDKHDASPAAELRTIAILVAQNTATRPANAAPAAVALPPAIAAAFQAFVPKVKTHADDKFLYVESDGIPAHNMMVGITAWQQQVPLPQRYTGDNAWRIPLHPVPSKTPASIKNRFLRGAIALAANGIPIFNPQNNRGEVSQEIGELDQWGGHCGRADDYHYHAAPLHLQTTLGKNKPIAFALDGYPIYGLTEPDGSTPAKLDAFNGHETAALGYHYHGSTKYPYVNGGFHGEVVERDNQVDPQPRAQPVRRDQPPLRGAKITGFTAQGDKSFSLKYEVAGETRYVNYTIKDDGSVQFTFVDGQKRVQTETYTRRERGAGGGGPRERRPGGAAGQPDGPRGLRGPNPNDPNRQPWLKVHAKEMDANNDGTLTREELVAEVEKVFAGYDKNKDGRLTRDEYEGPGGVRSAMGGFVKQHAKELDTNDDGTITEEELLANAMRMFEKTDKNHDGKLTPDELTLPPGYKPTPPDGSQQPSKRQP